MIKTFGGANRPKRARSPTVHRTCIIIGTSTGTKKSSRLGSAIPQNMAKEIVRAPYWVLELSRFGSFAERQRCIRLTQSRWSGMIIAIPNQGPTRKPSRRNSFRSTTRPITRTQGKRLRKESSPRSSSSSLRARLGSLRSNSAAADSLCFDSSFTFRYKAPQWARMEFPVPEAGNPWFD